VPGTYDPELNLVYFGTGNPGPDLVPSDGYFGSGLLGIAVRRWEFKLGDKHGFQREDVFDQGIRSDLRSRARHGQSVDW